LKDTEPIYNIAEVCFQLHITDVVICPGSRSAPLAISFAKHRQINTKIIPDERSAAYIALGMAQISQKTVALVCTSGTAVLNFAPAIAEAFFQQIPLLVLTGDRPPEWIGQGDGQTIYQNHIFGKNIKKSYQLPVEKWHKDALWNMYRQLNEAINFTQTAPFGPVHINIPLREPFYPDENGINLDFSQTKIYKNYSKSFCLNHVIWIEIQELIKNAKNILIVAGHSLPDDELVEIIEDFQYFSGGIPLIADINSNLQETSYAICNANEILINQKSHFLDDIKPDFILSFGIDFISKNLKQWLRKQYPAVHLHVRNDDLLIDTFQNVTHTITVDKKYFFKEIKSYLEKDFSNKSYLNTWLLEQSKYENKLQKFISQSEFGELMAVQYLLDKIPYKSILQLGNSLSVRYASIFSAKNTLNFCNRGTSGIDGCVSTAVGSSFKTEQIVTLLVGDMSFLYDKNAFWHNYLISNLRIIVLNNQGGNIFRSVDGAKDQPELEEYFVTEQRFSAQSTALEFRFDYFLIEKLADLENVLTNFFEPAEQAKLIEVKSDGKENALILAKMKAFMAEDH
jgi:2-succinyl-5-enolpyruvyl-6-hydroxy-3-cyclohexene-1-carboxylate synthase